MTDIDPAAVMAAHNEHGSDEWGEDECRNCHDDWPCEPYRLAEALAGARKDVEEYAPILDRCSQLLTAVANALKGSPPPLTSWSHHDLPEKAQATVDALAASEAKVARVEALALAIRTGHASGNSGAIYAALADDPASRT